MSYAEAKKIALLRLELRAQCCAGDRAGARETLARFARAAGEDPALVGELRRWELKLDAAHAA